MSTALTAFEDAFQTRRERLPGAGLTWLDEARTRAMQQFQERGFPNPREEDWKYTRTASMEKIAFDVVDALPDADIADALLDLPGARLVFVDGHFHPGVSTTVETRSGGLALDLTAGLDRHTDLLRHYLTREPDPRRSAFCALNTALTGNGAVVYAPRDQPMQQPVQLVFIASGRGDTMSHPRVLVAAEPGSELTIVEHHLGLGTSRYMNNVLTEVSVGANAGVTHYKLQREASTAFHMSTLQVHQAADSRFTSHSVSLGGAIARHDIMVDLDGRGAACVLNGLYAAAGRQHVDYHTTIEHRVPHCTSQQDYKGVLGGRSRGVFNGRVVVHEHAQKTDSSQSNKNLLLSPDAEVDTKPQLEIYADDVKCAHGATVGQLDERMVFYLRSRGLAEAEARALLTYGFACDVVDRMELEPLRAIAAESLLHQMPDAGELRSMLS